MKRSGIWAGVHEVPPGEIAACMSSECEDEFDAAAVDALTKRIDDDIADDCRRMWSAENVDADERRPSYPLDAKDVPGDYVLCGDGRWYPHPVVKADGT